VNGVGAIQKVGKESGEMKDKILELIHRVKFILELRAFDKEKRKEDWLINNMIKEQTEIDRILDTKYADDLTKKNKEEE
jgi:hypothetical protein